MNTSCTDGFRANTLAFIGIVLAATLFHSTARGAEFGSVEGRVFNPATQSYVENARVSIEGADLETFTDVNGSYRIASVPVGPQTIVAFFTGVPEQHSAITVESGRATQLDIQFGDYANNEKPNAGPLKLDRYEVRAFRQLSGAAIAINEQRFAPNVKTVLSADEFGSASENDIGEFLKFIPGVTMEYMAGDARQVSLGGVGFNYTPVTFGGFGMTNGNQGGTNRGVALEQTSLNNVSRVEVIKSPTPESPGAALAGSINLVPRSAFERANSQLTFSTYISMRDDQRNFNKTVGPRYQPTRKVLPGGEFAYVMPVNSRFGFSVSGSLSSSYSSRDFMRNVWRGGNAATNGTTLPDTTADRPYLTDYILRDGFIVRDRSSLAVTFDYKLSSSDQVSLFLSRTTYRTDYDMRTLTFFVNRVAAGDFGQTFTNGFSGAGEIRVENEVRERDTATFMPTLTYRHMGKVWQSEAGIGYSYSTDDTKVPDDALSFTTQRRTGVTVSFADITSRRPGRIIVTDSTGSVDPFDISSYALTAPRKAGIENTDGKKSAYANISRQLSLAGIFFKLKGGIDVTQSIRDNDFPYRPTWTYVGKDGRTSTTPVGNDDLAVPFFNSLIANRPSLLNFPTIPVVSHRAFADYLQRNPSEFILDQNQTYLDTVTFSKYARETVSAGYVRVDIPLLQQRLKLVTGIRAEQTNVYAEGPLTDVTKNYQRDASGNVIRGSNGLPLPISTDALSVSQRTRIRRGSIAEKEYLRWFPSLNVSYNIRPNLIARIAYYQSIGRPDFNQYAGGITLPDIEAAASSQNVITVNNVAIKPWMAESFVASLEYYFERVGLISVSAFRRDFKNFFATADIPATPDFLELYGLDPTIFGDYLVRTQSNLNSTVRMEGISIDYKQALTFTPNWARGFQVFANATLQTADGAQTGSFQFSPKVANFGLSYARGRFSARFDANYRGKQKVSTLTGRSIEAGTTRWAPVQHHYDVTTEFAVTKYLSLFAKFRNVTDEVAAFDFYGPSTPQLAKLQQFERYGALWTFGLKGVF